MLDELNNYFNKILTKYQRGFWKRFRIHHYFLAMTKKVRERLDSGRVSAAPLTDISRAFCFL